MIAAERRIEQYRTQGEKLVARVRELVREGNVRRITIRNDEGRALIEVPLTVGVVGAVLVPTWAAIAAIAAIVTDCSIEVERATPEEEAAHSATRPTPVGIEHEIDTEC